MNILAIIKNGENKYQLRPLIDNGHNVIIVNDVETASYSNINVIVSLSEDTVEDAFNMAQRYNIPFYAHIDWIKPWMVFKESEHNWGYIEQISFSDKMNFIRKYQNIAMYWSMADVKSMSANCFHELMRELTGILDMNIYTKYPVPDVKKIKKHVTNKRVNKITYVGKFIAYTRIHHLIKALQMIEFDGTLALVGSGNEKNLYEAIKGDLHIEYYSDLEKYDVMADSRLVVSLWSGTVPGESLLLGVPVIAYDSKYMREIYDDNITFVTNNSISELARAIKLELKRNRRISVEFKEDVTLEKLINKTVRK